LPKNPEAVKPREKRLKRNPRRRERIVWGRNKSSVPTCASKDWLPLDASQKNSRFSHADLRIRICKAETVDGRRRKMVIDVPGTHSSAIYTRAWIVIAERCRNREIDEEITRCRWNSSQDRYPGIKTLTDRIGLRNVPLQMSAVSPSVAL